MKGAKKQADRQAGVMSFDTFFGEAGTFNNAEGLSDDYSSSD